MGRSDTAQIGRSENLGNLKLLWELLKTGPITVWCVMLEGLWTAWCLSRKAKLRSFLPRRSLKIHSLSSLSSWCVPPSSIPPIYLANSIHPAISPSSPSVHPSSNPSSHPYVFIQLSLPYSSIILPHPPSSTRSSVNPLIYYPTCPSSPTNSLHSSICPSIFPSMSIHSYISSLNHLLIHWANCPFNHLYHHPSNHFNLFTSIPP